MGVPSEQAEVQAEVLTEAFNVNLEELVTKDYLTAEFAKQSERIAHELADIKANFRNLYWTLGLITLLVVVPALQNFLGT